MADQADTGMAAGVPDAPPAWTPRTRGRPLLGVDAAAETLVYLGIGFLLVAWYFGTTSTLLVEALGFLLVARVAFLASRDDEADPTPPSAQPVPVAPDQRPA